MKNYNKADLNNFLALRKFLLRWPFEISIGVNKTKINDFIRRFIFFIGVQVFIL